jgi:hypothetical protein
MCLIFCESCNHLFHINVRILRWVGCRSLRAFIYKDKKRKSVAAAFAGSSDVRANTPPAREIVPKAKQSGLKGGRRQACNVSRRTPKRHSATPTEATNGIASVTIEATNGIDSVTTKATNNVARATKPVFSPEQCAAADAVVQQALENIKRKQEAQVQPPVFVPVFEYEVSQDDLPMIDDWSSVIGSIGH